MGDDLTLLAAAVSRLSSALSAADTSASTAALAETAVELARREDVRLVFLSPAGLEKDVARFILADAGVAQHPLLVVPGFLCVVHCSASTNSPFASSS